MTADLSTQLAEVLAAHQFTHCNYSSVGPEDHCSCGARPRFWQGYTTHLAAVLQSLPGVAIIQLPEPDEEPSAWSVDMPQRGATGWVYLKPFGGIGYPRYADTVQSARQLAAALWAAAAESEETP